MQVPRWKPLEPQRRGTGTIRPGTDTARPMAQVIVPVSGGDADLIRTQVHQARSLGADLVELRLDLCAVDGMAPDALEQLVGDIGSWPLPVVATCRHRAEGGGWLGEEDQRMALLLAADTAGAAYIDVELAYLANLPERPQRAQLILSQHDFSGMGGDLHNAVRAMRAAGAAIAKIAVTPSDAADLDVVANLCATFGRWSRSETDRGELIAIAMGEVGLPSRLLAGAWGASMTFARLPSDDDGSAPGQPPVDLLVQRYRVQTQGQETCIFGVLGDPVGHSISPLIHNTAFNHHNLDAVYVPFLAHDAAAFWQACGDWIDGLSITIPHKTALFDAMDEIEPLAAAIGAINTVYRDDEGRTVGANTDAPAAVDCVESCGGQIDGRRVLLLGAGGVSRAIAFAMHDAGADVTIANRTPARAQALANEVGCQATSLDAAGDLAYDVLVNGTSVGMNDDSASPWPEQAHRNGSVVFDTVYTPMETRLLREAQERGGQPVCGLTMLIGQALGQYERWTGLEAPASLMQRVALEHLGASWPSQHCTERNISTSRVQFRRTPPSLTR